MLKQNSLEDKLRILTNLHDNVHVINTLKVVLGGYSHFLPSFGVRRNCIQRVFQYCNGSRDLGLFLILINRIISLFSKFRKSKCNFLCK